MKADLIDLDVDLVDLDVVLYLSDVYDVLLCLLLSPDVFSLLSSEMMMMMMSISDVLDGLI